MELAVINGESGTLNFDSGGRLINVFIFEIADGAIQAIRWSSTRTSWRTSGFD